MKQSIGMQGESIAEAHLISLGHRIIEKNYRCRFGEIDIITQVDDVFHFVEVKTVYHAEFHPLEQITAQKIGRLTRSIYYYVKQKRLGDIALSLDGLGIVLSNGEVPAIYYEENITL